MMGREITAIWVPLALSPLIWLVITLGMYLAARRVQKLLGAKPYFNPVLITIVPVAAIVVLTGTPYKRYFEGAQFINFLLGPATVALAVPLARNIHHVMRSLHSIGLALLAGSMTSIITGVGIVWLLGGSRIVALSMAPKAVTTPIAIAVSQEIGGIPALTAALAILGGIVAAVVGQRLLWQFKIEDWRVHGLAAGVAGSGIAAAQVAPLDGMAAAFAALGIAINGVVTAIVVPLLVLVLS